MRIKNSKIHCSEDDGGFEGEWFEDDGFHHEDDFFNHEDDFFNHEDDFLGRCLRYTSANLFFHIKEDCFCWEKRKSFVYWKEDSL